MIESEVRLNENRAVEWSGATLVAALRAIIAHFEPHVPVINALNVFPVPDGDTGTNMFLTLQAAERETADLARTGSPTAGEILQAASHGALMGARGNSGVILYQIIAGICQVAQNETVLNGRCLALGLRKATELAYKAVVTPVEGTMLTVIREAAEAVERDCAGAHGIETALVAALAGAESALQRTPELLDRLRQAGVVDAGGQGLVEILRALRRFAAGLEPDPGTVRQRVDVAAAMDFLDVLDIEHELEAYGYCTNFVVTGEAIALERFQQRMDELGTSAVIVGDERALKIHIHSEHPGLILEAALTFGELHQVRIDNMAAQTQRLLQSRAANRPVWVAPEPDKVRAGIAVIAVASGNGLAKVLMGMGAKAVVPGGPSFNPSTQDILAVVESVSQDEIILLPNDSNVIPTAQQVERLTDRTIRVVPTRSVPEGIAALASFNFELALDDNLRHMTEAATLVQTLAVTRAIRTVQLDGVTAVEGQFIGLLAGRLVSAGDDLVAVVLASLREARAGDAELLTVFTGEPADPDLGETVVRAIEDAYPDLVTELIDGSQPHYHLIISVE